MDILSDPIIRTAMRLQKIARDSVLDKIGLSSISVKILFIINSAVSISSSDILEIVGGTRSNISQRLTYLEKNGFIARTHHPSQKDKRIVLITLTPVGKKKVNSIKKWITKANIRIEKHFTKAELDAHHAFFAKLSTILDKHSSCHDTSCKK